MAVIWPNDTIDAYRFPAKKIDTLPRIVQSIKNNCMIESIEAHWLIEDIHAVRGSSAKGTFTFGRNLGHWEGILYSCGIEWELISPRIWQESLLLPKQKPDRKRTLKKLAQRLVNTTDTKFNVTLATADAILIAKFFKDKGGNNGTK